MKIAAIRLANAGRFVEPVAIENFGGGLDVLIAPNEQGKSTILRALRAVLLEKHTSSGGARTLLNGLKPYAGGDPLIEVDLDVGDRKLRLRKQFGRGRAARLIDARSGAVLAGNAEAEQQIASLLAGIGPTPESLGLLWVGQRQVFDALAPQSATLGPIQSAIENEIAAAAAGPSAARRVRARARELLAPLITEAHRRPKVGGDYERALRRRDSARVERDKAATHVAAIEEELEELSALAQQRARLADPTLREALEAAVGASDERLQKANDAREQQALARAELAAAEQRRSSAERELAAHDRSIAAINQLEQALELARLRRAALSEQQSSHEETGAQLAEQVGALRARTQQLRQALAAAHARDRHAAQQVQLADLQARLARARALSTEIERHAALLGASKVTPKNLAAIEREARAVILLRDRIAASATLLRVTYAPGGAGRMRVGPDVIGEGVELRAESPLEIVIEGVGTISVAPGGGADVETDRADLAAADAELALLLSQVDAADVETARAMGSAREAVALAHATTKAELAALVPSGVDTLVREHSALRAVVEGEGAKLAAEVPTGSAEELMAQVQASERELADAERRLQDARQVYQAGSGELSGLDGRIEALDRQYAHAIGDLPSADQREEVRRELERACERARAQFGDVLLATQAADRAAPSREDFAAMVSARDAARRGLHRHDEDRHHLETRYAGLSARLEEVMDSGVAGQLPLLEAELAEAERQVGRIEREISALLLVGEALDHVSEQARDRFLQPVVVRLGPYLGAVLPEAKLALDQELKVVSLERGALTEGIAALSDGTQEQIAILVRLALAQLLAEGGNPTPVILDDALVYADDRRIELMFEALQIASRRHQVVVFTCRERSFAGLGGNRLELAPWRPE